MCAQGKPTQEIADVDDLLSEVWNLGGTDLLITAGMPPMLRIDGELQHVEDHPALTAAQTATMVEGLLSEGQRQKFSSAGRDVDFSFTWRSAARIRGNAFHQNSTVALALRMIPRTIPTFEDIGMPEAVQKFIQLRQGLVLVTGSTGSGKSTTLASIIDWINANRSVHILTIEDPIEFFYDHKRSAVNQREVGADTNSFAEALRSCLREDPDVILVGELRDLESIRFALTLAETGHLVFATLHTNDTAQAVDRLVDVFTGEQQPQIRVQLATTLTGVIYQRLLPRLGGGMVAAYEVLTGTTAVRNLIKEGKANQLRNQIITGQRDGMQTLEQSLSELVTQGIVSYDEAVARSIYPRDIERGPTLLSGVS